jgi:hypothetical protein
LQPICDIPRNKAPSKEPKPTIRRHDRHCGINVSDTSLIDLAISFNDTQGVGYRIGNDGGAKTYKGLADNFFTYVVGKRESLLSLIEWTFVS